MTSERHPENRAMATPKSPCPGWLTDYPGPGRLLTGKKICLLKPEVLSWWQRDPEQGQARQPPKTQKSSERFFDLPPGQRGFPRSWPLANFKTPMKFEKTEKGHGKAHEKKESPAMEKAEHVKAKAKAKPKKK